MLKSRRSGWDSPRRIRSWQIESGICGFFSAVRPACLRSPVAGESAMSGGCFSFGGLPAAEIRAFDPFSGLPAADFRGISSVLAACPPPMRWMLNPEALFLSLE
jgi:hypothetical protein